MNLISTARALDDQHFRWRVQAAALEKAAAFAAMTTPGTQRNYAFYTLLNPQAVDPSLLALVAIDDVVAGAIEVSADGGTVDTRKVPDAEIVRAVNAAWPLVAVKYPRDPLNPSNGAPGQP
jgi:copper(I)-binding protein